jgi:hypothetical protein
MSFDPRFKKYNFQIDLERLKEETERLLFDSSTGKYRTQMSLQTNGTTDWDSSTGTREGEDEAQWDQIHPDLAGSWWEGFLKSFPFKLYRARLMTMHPRTCYSIHVDNNPRIHIAIKTHRQARFIFTVPPAVRHIPADGTVWWVDTTKEHSAMNGSMEDRIHLVACLVNTAEE